MKQLKDMIHQKRYVPGDVEVFFSYVKRARTNDSRFQYHTTYALSLIQQFQYEAAKLVIEHAKEYVEQESVSGVEKSRYYRVLALLSEEFERDFIQALAFYQRCEQVSPIVKGYIMDQMRCLMRINHYQATAEFCDLFETSRTETMVPSRHNRFYNALFEAMVAHKKAEPVAAKQFLIKAKHVLMEREESIMQRLLKQHRIQSDEVRPTFASSDYKGVAKALKK